MYEIQGYNLFRNDDRSNHNRPHHGTAVYSRLQMVNGYPCSRNSNGIEFSIIKTACCPNLIIIGIYRSPRVTVSRLLTALRTILDENESPHVIIIGDLNINWLGEVDRRSLYNLLVNENHLQQLISNCTTDNGTLIDHLYTNLLEHDVYSGTLETYFSDHKAIWASVKLRR